MTGSEMMEIKPIYTQADYQAALQNIESLLLASFPI